MDQRGASFFTSRPLPIDALTEVTILVGSRYRSVLATQEEAAKCSDGRPPLVRAFTVHGRTMPWYEWEGYEPYANYYAARFLDWQCFGSDVIASWMTTDKCDPRLRGYSGESVEDEHHTVEDAVIEEMTTLFLVDDDISDGPQPAMDAMDTTPQPDESTADTPPEFVEASHDDGRAGIHDAATDYDEIGILDELADRIDLGSLENVTYRGDADILDELADRDEPDVVNEVGHRYSTRVLDEIGEFEA